MTNEGLEHRTIIVTSIGGMFLDIKFLDASIIVGDGGWGQRYYAPDSDTAMLVELNYERREDADAVHHCWTYAHSVAKELNYHPDTSPRIEEIPDSKHKHMPSYFTALAQEVEETSYISRGQLYARYSEPKQHREQEPGDEL